MAGPILCSTGENQAVEKKGENVVAVGIRRQSPEEQVRRKAACKGAETQDREVLANGVMGWGSHYPISAMQLPQPGL